MKRISSFAKTVGASALCCAFWGASLAAFAQETSWILNNGADFENAFVGQGEAFFENGLAKIVATDGDCTFAIPIDEKNVFSAAERPYFALRYKISSPRPFGGLFFTTDETTALSDETYSQFPIVGDGTWRDLVVDMRTFEHKRWRGTVGSFRLDPTNPSDPGASIELSRLGFFPTEDAARAFLAEANDAPNFALDAVFNAFGRRCFVPGGTLSEGYSRDDYLTQNALTSQEIREKGVRPEEIVVVRVRDGEKTVVPLCDATSFGFATYLVRESGPYRLEVSDAASKLTDISGRRAENAIRFVVCRGVLPSVSESEFRPDEKADSIAISTQWSRLELDDDAFENRLKNESNAITREEAAVAIAAAIKRKLRTEIDAPLPPEYFGRDRIRIGAWGNFRAADFDENYFRTYRDCGFDFLLAVSGLPSKKVLNLGNRFGVEIYLNDGSYQNPEEKIAEYCDYPSFGGCFVTDEPGSDDFDALAAKCNSFAEITGKTPYINLLPMYANAAQLKYGAGAAAIEYYDSDPDLFRKYCEDFCRKFNVDYICTDIYPLNWSPDGKKTTYSEYVESINIIATVAREYDREFWCYIQTFAWVPSKRTPTEAEYRWQCYSMLAFGCKCILCWTYAGYEKEFPSLVDVESRRTPAWYDARPVFGELRRLSDEFVRYRNVGAFTHNCSDKTPYLKMSGEYKDFETIREIQCADPLLIGCFEKKEDEGAAFVLTNMTELEENRGTTARLQLNGSKAIAWYRGVPETVDADADGFFSFHLASGEGVFVTVEK